MYRFNEDHTLSALTNLPISGLVALAASCSSRFSVAYNASQRILGIEDAHIFDDALKALWKFAETGEEADWASIYEQLISLIVDEDEGGTILHGIVDDALASAAYAIRAAMSGDPRAAIVSARRAYETVDRWASFLADDNVFNKHTENEIVNSPIVQAELARQHHDLSDLEAASPEELGKTIDLLRKRSMKTSIIPTEYVNAMII